MRCRAEVVAALAILLTACSPAASPGEPASQAPTTSDRFGAPAVERPVDVSAVVDSPCMSLLSALELLGMGLTPPGRPRTSIDVQECRWTGSDQQSLSLAVDADRDLLADTYRTRNDPVFIPTEVEGFPAVRQKSSLGAPNVCTVTTGLGPRQALEATWVGRGEPRPGNDACEFAEQATALVVRKLPPVG